MSELVWKKDVLVHPDAHCPNKAVLMAAPRGGGFMVNTWNDADGRWVAHTAVYPTHEEAKIVALALYRLGAEEVKT